MPALLEAFDPHVAGTPPLGLDLPTSDVDVLCHAPDLAAFASVLWHAYKDRPRFSIRQWIGVPRPVIASFEAEGWTFEVFGSTQPVHEQAGWRHFLVERRLLELGGAAFRQSVMRYRLDGLKTEPAFAAALGLAGDPYVAMLDLGERSDSELAGALATAGFAPCR